MTGLLKIFDSNEVVAIVIQNNVKINGLQFFSNLSDPFQIGIHDYKETKKTNLHTNKLFKNIILNKKNKYLHIVKGTVLVILSNPKSNFKEEIKLERGDSIVIFDTTHQVIFNKNSRAIEIKQGPYENDK